MLHQTIEKLHALKLAAMADGLLAQTRQPDIDALGFEDRLALLVDLQHTAVQNAALGQRLKASRLRQRPRAWRISTYGRRAGSTGP